MIWLASLAVVLLGVIAFMSWAIFDLLKVLAASQQQGGILVSIQTLKDELRRMQATMASIEEHTAATARPHYDEAYRQDHSPWGTGKRD